MLPIQTVTEPMKAYLAREELSRSELVAAAIGPELWRSYTARGPHDDSTRSTDLGTIVHTLVLEPDAAIFEYTPEPDPASFTNPKTGEPYASPRSCKAYQSQVATLKERGLTVVRRDDWATATMLRDRVQAHPVAGPLMRGEGAAHIHTEKTMLFEWMGHPSKSRADRVLEYEADDMPAVCIDLKTTSKPLEGFRWSVNKWGYDYSPYWYTEAIRYAGSDAVFKWIVVETIEPFRVAVFSAGTAMMEASEILCGFARESMMGWADNPTLVGFPDDLEVEPVVKMEDLSHTNLTV